MFTLVYTHANRKCIDYKGCITLTSPSSNESQISHKTTQNVISEIGLEPVPRLHLHYKQDALVSAVVIANPPFFQKVPHVPGSN